MHGIKTKRLSEYYQEQVLGIFGYKLFRSHARKAGAFSRLRFLYEMGLIYIGKEGNQALLHNLRTYARK